MYMVNTTYKSTEDMINIIQDLKRNSKLNFYKNLSNYYDDRNIRMDKDPFCKIARGIIGIYHELLLLMKFLPSKPEVNNVNNNYYDLYYSVIKNRDDDIL